MEKDLINTADAAKILDVSTATLRQWRNRKLFGCPFFPADEKHGDTWYYERERVEQLKEVYQKGVLQNMYKLAKKFAEKELSDNFQKRVTSEGHLDSADKIFYDADEVADFLGVNEKTLDRWRKNGKLVEHMQDHNGLYWYSAADVHKFKAERDAQKNNSQDSWLADYQARFKPTVTDADIVAIRKLTANPDKFNELKQKILLIDPDKIFQNDRYKGYICPICGSGSGRHGTGFQRPKNAVEDKNGFKKYRYFCFVCGNFKGDLLNIIANINGLDLTNDFLQIMAIGKKILESAYNGNFDDISPVIPPVKTNKISDDEFILIKDDIFRAQQNFDHMPATADFTRGISIDVLKKIRAGYLTDWIHPDCALDPNKPKIPSRRLIIPCDSESYDSVMPLCDRNEYNQKFKNLHAGTKTELFSVYSSDGRTSFKDFRFALIFEGSIDALSAYEVNPDYWALASLGTTNLDNTVNFLNRDFETNDDRFNFQPIVIFDNETTANQKALELVDALKNFGYPAISLTLGKIGADKIDANSILMKDGRDDLKSKLAELVTDAQKQLPAIQAELKTSRADESAHTSTCDNTTAQVDSEDPIQKIKSKLQWARDSHGHPTHVKGTQKNLNLIFDHDPLISGLIGYDEFYEREVLLKQVDWKKNGAGTEWTDTDDAHLYCYLRDTYTEIKGKDSIRDTVIVYSRKNSFHPVKKYLESLVWDGIPRAEEFFIKFLKVEDSPYSREVTVKWLLGAISRIFYPGCDFQYALALQGAQGIGKGFSARMLGQKWHITLDDNLDDSHALDAIRSGWIVEIEELAAARKSEINAVKSFLSRGIDTRRAAYERREHQFKRHCVFIITVNDSQFLRDHTGNRRFKILKCNNKPKEIVLGLTPEYVDQVWAEMFHRYQLLFADGFNPALLMLSRDSEILSEEIAESYLMDDGIKGEIENFLYTKILPSYIWELLTKEERRRFIANASIDLKLQDINLRIRTRYGKNQNAAQVQVDAVDSYTRENINRAVAKIEPADVKKTNSPKEIGLFYRFYGTVERAATCASEIFCECFGSDKRKSMARINEILSTLEGWTLDGKRQKNFAGCYGDQKKIYSRQI